MENRKITRLGREVSVVGLGCWQLGADWGEVDENDALAVLHAAADAGVTFFDTADVYGDGRSERLVGRFLAERGDVFVATKMGRRAEQVPENYVAANFREWNDRSRRNLGVDTLDLVQLHCPPTPVYSSDAVYDALDEMVAEGRIKAYGVSVETCEEALTAMARPERRHRCRSSSTACGSSRWSACCPRRRRPAWGSSRGCRWRRGCCPGATRRPRRSPPTTTGTTTATARRSTSARPSPACRSKSGWRPSSGCAGSCRRGRTLAQFALRWIIDQPGVSTVIPGARNAAQASANTAAAGLPPLSPEALAGVRETYDELIRPLVHDRW